ncbi:hypothetical protein M569_17675 [Genlisea aurea]|uniref:Uncharacterized protein n=1 Tax=Genlisea aurea TaxID=192259 RepID=S8BY89_9LAMI|nr:hypothetical protein M569_17675 [Genlisea aurea]
MVDTEVQDLGQILAGQVESMRHDLGHMEARVNASWGNLTHAIDNRFEEQNCQTQQLLAGQSATIQQKMAWELENTRRVVGELCQQQQLETLAEVARLKGEILQEVQENLVSIAHRQDCAQEMAPTLINNAVENYLRRNLPLQQAAPATSPEVELLKGKVAALEGVARRLAPLENLVQRVEALESVENPVGSSGNWQTLEMKVQGLETEVAKYPPVLLSHQSHVMALRKGVDGLGKRLDQQVECVQRGQLEVESFREWKRGASQKIGEVENGARQFGTQITALDKKVDALWAHEKSERAQTFVAVEGALEQVGLAMRELRGKVQDLESEVHQKPRSVPSPILPQPPQGWSQKNQSCGWNRNPWSKGSCWKVACNLDHPP